MFFQMIRNLSVLTFSNIQKIVTLQCKVTMLAKLAGKIGNANIRTVREIVRLFVMFAEQMMECVCSSV